MRIPENTYNPGFNYVNVFFPVFILIILGLSIYNLLAFITWWNNSKVEKEDEAYRQSLRAKFGLNPSSDNGNACKTDSNNHSILASLLYCFTGMYPKSNDYV